MYGTAAAHGEADSSDRQRCETEREASFHQRNEMKIKREREQKVISILMFFFCCWLFIVYCYCFEFDMYVSSAGENVESAESSAFALHIHKSRNFQIKDNNAAREMLNSKISPSESERNKKTCVNE